MVCLHESKAGAENPMSRKLLGKPLPSKFELHMHTVHKQQEKLNCLFIFHDGAFNHQISILLALTS